MNPNSPKTITFPGGETAHILSRAEVREIDRQAAEVFGVPGIILMENAGRSLVESILRHREKLLSLESALPVPSDHFRKEARKRTVLILAGPGNNGGDGFVMARRLHLLGFTVIVAAFGKEEGDGPWRNEAEVNRLAIEKLTDERLAITYFLYPPSDPSAILFDLLESMIEESDLLVDALLGTGAKGSPRPPFDRLIRIINGAGKPVFAVDIPSGLDGDSGTATGDAVRADVTCSLAAIKTGLLSQEATPYVGELDLGDIGFNIESVITDRPRESAD